MLSHAILDGLTFDSLRRMQATLANRMGERSSGFVKCVGFAPQRTSRTDPIPPSSFPVTAQFDIAQSSAPANRNSSIASNQPIAAVESLRLLDRATRRYQRIELETQVQTAGRIVPTGVRVSLEERWATGSVVVRWTRTDPVPPLPSAQRPDDPRWRWGLLSVAHLFAGKQSAGKQSTPPLAATVERRLTCGEGPVAVLGEVVASGRLPGGPDISLVETGLDRLWLSGMLTRPDTPSIEPARESQLLRWISAGTQGTFLADGKSIPWQWQTYYPELNIAQLGNLQQIVRYQTQSVPQSGAPPFGPGSSGGILVSGGIPVAMQVAAVEPDFTVGYAQLLEFSLEWLRQRLRATALQIAQLLVD